ncbi:hypothetical protein L0M97_14210, partial [[Ruminococcus] torques]|uniref:hypothetical protein n=1 Tax=[Ruminococcus] torques TaxID=33039 RepID=UPI001EE0E027
AEVTFTHVFGPTPSPSSDVQYTDSNGEATTSAFIAGTSVGNVEIDASAGGQTVTFSHANVPGPVASLSVVGGTG